jgi:hypothetical protein
LKGHAHERGCYNSENILLKKTKNDECDAPDNAKKYQDKLNQNHAG